MRKLFGRKTQEQRSQGNGSSQDSANVAQGSESSASSPFRARGDELARNNDYNGAAVMYEAALLDTPNDRSLQEALDEVRARQAEIRAQSRSLESSAPGIQPQPIAQHGFAATEDQEAANISREPPSYDESQREDRTIAYGSTERTDKPLDAKNELKEAPMLDHESMLAELMPEDPSLETLEQAHHTWHIPSWKGLGQKEYGPIFECGGSPWQLFIFPNGNNVDSVSLYFQHGYKEGKIPEDWYKCVQFAVVMWNPYRPSKYVSSAAKHKFNCDEGDWGFTRFCARPGKPSQDGFKTPPIDGDEVNITAYVRVIKDPTGVLWHNFFNYDSKKVTGMVGLKNQGATGYLNAVLQSLYFTNSLRKVIYQVPTDENAKTDVVWALQRLFYALQSKDSTVCTQELTASFGWGPLQVFKPQDLKEMSTILIQRLDRRLQSVSMKGALMDILAGEVRRYAISTKVGYGDSTSQSMWDIDLVAHGLSSLEGGFKDYIRSEILQGKNQIDLGRPYGLQDGVMGTTFTHLPPVLQIYLKRFYYDFRTNSLVKSNNYFQFPEEFDASPYLSSDTDKSESWKYLLVGVTVHSGDTYGGQYYVFRRPTKDGPFYKFDDQIVSRATLREVMDENFGGEASRLNSRQARVRTGDRPVAEKSRNAYMLVYVRKSRLDDVFVDVTEDDVPEHIRKQTV